MRVAVVTESFLPRVNGVTNSVLRVCEQLTARGHEVLVVAPGPGPDRWGEVPVVRTPSLPLPGYADFRVGAPVPGVTAALRRFRPDVVHLASPAVLGAHGATVAARLGVPAVAVYQTDLAGFAERYRLGVAGDLLWHRLRRVHGLAARTLAPSTHAVRQLEERGVERVVRWARGVDLDRWNPGHRDPEVRRALAPGGERVVGYVGRLAHEKEVGLLAAAQATPGVRLVVVGDGPQRRQLERLLPRAEFLGFRSGPDLSRLVASFDVFAHTGSHETFCQAAQEALASGVPVVGPAAGGLLDLVEDGSNGLRFAPGDGEDLARCVERLVTDDVGRRRMGIAARRSVEGRSWEVIGDELVGHYGAVA